MKIKEFQESVMIWINWIAIGLMAVALLILRMFSFDGSVGIKDFPTTAWGWVIWTITGFAPAIIGVFIVHAFRSEGIRQGHKDEAVKAARAEWFEQIAFDKVHKPISKSEYLRKEAIKDFGTKFTLALGLSIVSATLVASADWEALIGLLLQLGTFAGIGMLNMGKAAEFCTDNLVAWYKSETERIKKEKNMEVQDNGGKQQDERR